MAFAHWATLYILQYYLEMSEMGVPKVLVECRGGVLVEGLLIIDRKALIHFPRTKLEFWDT